MGSNQGKDHRNNSRVLVSLKSQRMYGKQPVTNAEKQERTI